MLLEGPIEETSAPGPPFQKASRGGLLLFQHTHSVRNLRLHHTCITANSA